MNIMELNKIKIKVKNYVEKKLDINAYNCAICIINPILKSLGYDTENYLETQYVGNQFKFNINLLKKDKVFFRVSVKKMNELIEKDKLLEEVEEYCRRNSLEYLLETNGVNYYLFEYKEEKLKELLSFNLLQDEVLNIQVLEKDKIYISTIDLIDKVFEEHIKKNSNDFVKFFIDMLDKNLFDYDPLEVFEYLNSKQENDNNINFKKTNNYFETIENKKVIEVLSNETVEVQEIVENNQEDKEVANLENDDLEYESKITIYCHNRNPKKIVYDKDKVIQVFNWQIAYTSIIKFLQSNYLLRFEDVFSNNIKETREDIPLNYKINNQYLYLGNKYFIYPKHDNEKIEELKIGCEKLNIKLKIC